jgi:hypothetical protein
MMLKLRYQLRRSLPLNRDMVRATDSYSWINISLYHPRTLRRAGIRAVGPGMREDVGGTGQ